MSDCQKLRGEDQARSGLVSSPKFKPGSFLLRCLSISHFSEWLKHGCPVRKCMKSSCYAYLMVVRGSVITQEHSESDNPKGIVV